MQRVKRYKNPRYHYYRRSHQEDRGPTSCDSRTGRFPFPSFPSLTPLHSVFLSRPCSDPPGAALTQQMQSQAGPSLDWFTHPRPTQPTRSSCPGRRPTSDHACFASSPRPRPAAAAAIPAPVRQAPSFLSHRDRRHLSRLGAQAQNQGLGVQRP